MSTHTTNLNLVKPGATDPVNVSDINGNMDIIDGAVQGLRESVSYSVEKQKCTSLVGTFADNCCAVFGKVVNVCGRMTLTSGVSAWDTLFNLPANLIPGYSGIIVLAHYLNGPYMFRCYVNADGKVVSTVALPNGSTIDFNFSYIK